MKTNYCKCGSRMSKHSTECNLCHSARMATLHELARMTVDRGVCPQCGTKLVRNNSLAGWWQCATYACDAFRQPEFKGLPSCGFQIFTE
jgi:hypothetical protein